MSTLDFLAGFLPLVAILALPLTLIFSWVLLTFYRRRVIKLMSTSTMAESVPTLEKPETVHSAQLKLKRITSTSKKSFSSAASRLYYNVQRAPWRTASIYIIAGIVYTLLITTGFFIAGQIEFLPLRFAYAFLTFSWPLIPVLWITVADRLQIQAPIIATYALVYLGLGLIIAATEPNFGWNTIMLLWQSVNFWPTLALLLVLNRRVHAVAPLVIVMLSFSIAGVLGLTQLIGSNDVILHLLLGFLSASQLIITTIVAGFLFPGIVSALLLIRVRNRYQHQKISDQSVLVDTIWLLFLISHMIHLSFEGIGWVLYALSAFSIFKIIVWGGFALLRQKTALPKNALDLLLLRVFSLGKRSQRLYDAISIHWRHIGKINMIAGPDLATSTIEPHEFLDFMTGKLKHRFIDSEETLTKRITEMTRQPDHDGRYRVTEFFCYANMWKSTLSRLATEHDAILMDLRGFSAKNAGCIYEINTLIDLVPLEKALFVSDKTTDEAFLRQTLTNAWGDMTLTSPNRGTQKEAHIFHFERRNLREFPALLQAICLAATSDQTDPSASQANSPT